MTFLWPVLIFVFVSRNKDSRYRFDIDFKLYCRTGFDSDGRWTDPIKKTRVDVLLRFLERKKYKAGK